MISSSIRALPIQVAAALNQAPRGVAFPHFVIDNVLDDNEYDRLLAEFPDHLVGQSGPDGFASYTVRPNAAPIRQLSDSWKTFITTIRSDESKKGLVEACLEQTTRRYPTAWRWLLRSRLSNPNNYEINLAFSANYAGRYLPPHTDNSYKVLALVLYLAPRGDTRVDDGTQFFKPRTTSAIKSAVRKYNRLADSRLTRFTPLLLLPMTSCNIHNNCLTKEDVQASELWFERYFENDVSVSFRPNRIAGFIKTQSSFHAVDMRNSTLVGPRRSLLINLNLKHSLVARIGQKFRARILGLST
jgi:hypothetical protein